MHLVQLKYSLKAFLYLPITFIKRVVFGKDPYLRQYFWDKWGFLDKRLNDILYGAKDILWIDAASGGEILQLVTFLRKLKEKNPYLKIVFSTESDDAFRYARNLKTIDFVFNTPWDFEFIARRVMRQIKPRVFMTVEFTRIPLHFKIARLWGFKTVLLSGLMSCGWQQHPTMTRAFFLEYYRYFDFIGAKEERDRDGFIQCGVERDRVYVTGNMKFDLENLKCPAGDIEDLRNLFQINANDKIFLAASIFPPEEKIAIDSYIKIKMKLPELRMIIVPRFNKHISLIRDYLMENGIVSFLRSDLKKDCHLNGEVVIVNTFGELKRLYHLSDYIFLGGSVFPVNKIGGGKNIVEPLSSGKPIFFGPFMNYWKEIVEELKSIYERCEFEDADSLAEAIVSLDKDISLKDRLCIKTQELLHGRDNIITNNAHIVERLLLHQNPV